MGYNAQYKNHNAQYGAIEYRALGGSSFVNSYTESVTTANSPICTAVFIAAVSESSTGYDNETSIAIFNPAYTEALSSNDQLYAMAVCTITFGESATVADAENVIDGTSSIPLMEILLAGDAINADVLAYIILNEACSALDAHILFSNSSTPAERIFSILKEKRIS